MRRLGIAVISIALAFATGYAISQLRSLPYSSLRDQISDALSFPGGLIAGLVYSEGVHTGSGSAIWAVVAFGVNIAVYSMVWFVALSLCWRKFARKVPAPAH